MNAKIGELENELRMWNFALRSAQHSAAQHSDFIRLARFAADDCAHELAARRAEIDPRMAEIRRLLAEKARIDARLTVLYR